MVVKQKYQQVIKISIEIEIKFQLAYNFLCLSKSYQNARFD